MRLVKIVVIGASSLTLIAGLAAGCASSGKKGSSQSGTEGAKGWNVPKSAAKRKNPIKADSQSIAKGKHLFEQNCVSCHGESGEGNGPAASGLTPSPANLTAKYVQEQSDGALFYRIREGHKDMPSFSSELTDTQVWNIVNYVHTLGSS